MIGGGRFDWENWIRGLLAAFIGGGAGAVTGGVSASLIDPKDFSLGSQKFFALVVTIFVANGMITMMAYLHQNPVPPIKTITTTVETTEIQAHPAAKVTTTVEEKVVIPIDRPGDGSSSSTGKP